MGWHRIDYLEHSPGYCCDLGISTGKILVEKGIEDMVILEASDRFSGESKTRKLEAFRLSSVLVGSPASVAKRPIWFLASEHASPTTAMLVITSTIAGC